MASPVTVCGSRGGGAQRRPSAALSEVPSAALSEASVSSAVGGTREQRSDGGSTITPGSTASAARAIDDAPR
ncbi:hypothetical protein AAVH_28460 [Aphelenchoides avenae]|nr:hypothetical protein AAVH_28460 [Aphelenchus avenae]